MRRFFYGFGLFLTSAAAVFYYFLTGEVQRVTLVSLDWTLAKVLSWLWPFLFGALLAATLLLQRVSVADIVLSGVFALVNLAASLVLTYRFWFFYPVYSQLLFGVFLAAAVWRIVSYRRQRKAEAKATGENG